MSNATHTHWGMVINNYTETDLALVQQGYPDHIRQFIYTLERGEQGTPHIQAFIKMKRDCRLSHMKKLFPTGHFNFLDSSEYRLNAQRYAQKLDDTAETGATITNGDPLHTVEGTIRTIINRMIENYATIRDLQRQRRIAEEEAVMADYTMAKVFVSATYQAMWKHWGITMFRSLLDKVHEADTHTHTHTGVAPPPPPPPPKTFVDIGIQTDDADDISSCGSEDEVREDEADDGDSCGSACSQEGDSQADCEDRG